MSSKQEHPIQAMGFWLFGVLSVVLAVFKLTVAGYWSWWRVMLPFLAFLGHRRRSPSCRKGSPKYVASRGHQRNERRSPLTRVAAPAVHNFSEETRGLFLKLSSGMFGHPKPGCGLAYTIAAR